MSAQGAQGGRAGAAADDEIAAARRLVHELPAGTVDRQALFRFYVGGEDAESLCHALGLDEAQYDRIHARALQRYKEILRSARGVPEKTASGAFPLDLTAALRRGLTGFAAREAAGEAVERQGLLARLGSPGAILTLLILLLAALAAAGLLELRAHGLRKALEAAHLSAPAHPPEPADVLAAELQEARRKLDAESQRRIELLDKERHQRDQITQELERQRRPQTNTPILHLEHEPPPPAKAAPRHITQPALPGWMILSLDLEGVPAAPSYNAALLTTGGSNLWTGAGLLANPWRSLVITFPSTLLKPGDYRLVVTPVPLQGTPPPAVRYSFRVER